VPPTTTETPRPEPLPAAIPLGPAHEHPARDPALGPALTLPPLDDGQDGPTGLVLGTAGQHRSRRNRLLVMAQLLMKPGNPTDASMLLTGIVGLILTVLVYVFVLFPIRTTYVGTLFVERGWVPYATVGLALWAAIILVVKFWKLTSQQTALTYDLLPVDTSVAIHPGNVELVQHHLKRLPLNHRSSFLVNRLLLALDHFQARKDAQEVGTVLTAQADIDAGRVDSSYAMLRVLIWAIPILGFIGTVIGISDAVAGFTQSIQAAQELDVIKTALGHVTAGLATAFDTTLIALVLSMVIMFPTNSLQKSEEDLLSTVDQFCNENLLRRLQSNAEERTEEIQGLEAALHTLAQAQQAEFQQCLKRLETLETALFEKLIDGLAALRESMPGNGSLKEEVPQ
jgi:biopolymer transport protein ExbB/TolQ